MKIDLPEELEAAINEVARIEGRSPEAVVVDRLDLIFFGHIRRLPPLADTDMTLRARYKRSPMKAATRNRIYERDKGFCQHCKGFIFYDQPFHIDHLKPVSKGGGDEDANLALSCIACNLEKAAK